MILLFIGSPGSGKGTQAKRVAERLHLRHFSTGEIFRQMDNPEIDKYMGQGNLIPDEIVMRVFRKYIEKEDLHDDLLIDGSPRSLYQYSKFKDIFSAYDKNIDFAIYIRISDKEALRRLTSRREDKKTGEIYNLITNPPGPDVDPSNLVIRDDDKKEAVLERLRVQKVPEDMLKTIKEDGILIEIDGERPVEEITEDIISRLKDVKKQSD
jgi:adenylate kinase